MTTDLEIENKIFMRNLSAPIGGVMRFHLIYAGPLSASGNKPKPDEARNIRDQLSPQMKYLWETHHALKVLQNTAWVPRPGNSAPLISGNASPFDDGTAMQKARKNMPWMFTNFCEPISYGESSYVPLVRKSLDLNCGIDVLFLRQGDPGALVNQGGDIDNRIKTLLDALKMPDSDASSKWPPKSGVTYCLMESDTLVANLSVSTDRLLFAPNEKPNEVHLVVEVEIQVLRVGAWNVCLV
jgi:hypothetical protein